MNISISDVKIDTLYPAIKRIGFDGVDVKFPPWDGRNTILSAALEDSVLEKYNHLANAGLQVCQTHLTYYPGHLPPLGDGSYKAFEEYMLPIFTREIELVSKMNCNVAVIHLYFEESKEISRESNLQLLESLLPTAEKNNVVLAIENIYGPKYSEAHLSTAEDLLFYIDHFQSNYLGACLDTGHAVARKKNPVIMAEKLGRALRALHLHSNVPEKDLHLPPCLIQSVDWRAFYDTLVKIGYQGAFNMETTAPKQLSRNAALAYYNMTYCIADGLIHESKSWTEE